MSGMVLGTRRMPPLRIAIALFLATLGLMLLARENVARTFAQVRHPVTLNAANAQPDAAVLREWFQALAEQGTYLLMIRTELVDLLYALTLGLTITFFVRLLGVSLQDVHTGIARTLFLWAPLFALSGPLDLLENTFSLGMLTAPTTFPDWWAPARASLSAAKYTCAIVSPIVGFSMVGAAFWLRARTRKAA